MQLMPWRNKNRGDVRDVSLASPWGDLAGDIERMFGRFLGGPWSLGEGLESMGAWTPPMDITETDDKVLIRSEIPGVDPKDISVTVSGGMLTVKGEKKESTEKKGENYYHSERRFGSFQRVVELPASVDPEKVSADYGDGVLKVTLVKKAGSAAKKIPIAAK